MKKRIVVVLFILILALTGCQNSTSERAYTTDDYSDMSYSDMGDYEFAMEAAFESDAASNSFYSKAVSQDSVDTGTTARMIQRSASITITVLDPVSAMDEVIALADTMGGFVVSSSTGQRTYANVTLPYADVSIRVPAEKLNDSLAAIENLTSDKERYVTDKTLRGVDITSDYVDNQSRLTSKEKALAKLNEIMESAETAEEALAVYGEIAIIESDIEVLKGQIKYMEESVSLSSIDVNIEPIRPDPIISGTDWAPGETIVNAWNSLINAGKNLYTVVIYLIIVIVPLLVVIGIPVFFIVRAIRKHKKAKKTAAAPKEAENKPA